MTNAAGDKATSQFLRYIEGVSLQEVGRHREAVTVAMDLILALAEEPDLMWRAEPWRFLPSPRPRSMKSAGRWRRWPRERG